MFIPALRSRAELDIPDKLNQAASPMCLTSFPFFIMLDDFNFSNISAWFLSTIRFESLCWKSCRALVSFSYAFATSNFAFSRLREPLTLRLNDFCFLRKFRSARSKKRGLGIFTDFWRKASPDQGGDTSHYRFSDKYIYRTYNFLLIKRMRRAYRERFYPNEQQTELLAKSFGCCRFVWNNSLKYRTDAYYERGESIAHSVLEKRLVPLKAEFEWLKEVSSVIFQQALRDQQEAFKNFWEKRAKYPKFKSKHDKQAIRLTKAAFNYHDGQLFIAKSKKPLDIRWSRELPSEPSSITISKDKAGRYFVSMLCEFESKPMPVTAKTVGIDLGLNNLFITDSGEKVDNPRHTKRYENKLAHLQRQLPKKKKGINLSPTKELKGLCCRIRVN